MTTRMWMREVGRMIEEMGFGYRMEICRKHIKVRIQNGLIERMMVISASPSDNRAIYNVKKTIRQVMA